MPASSTPHRARPPKKMPAFRKNRKIAEPLLAGLSCLVEFWRLLIAAIVRLSPIVPIGAMAVSVTESFSVVSGQLTAMG
ncbi:Uncharacterised protein [Bordetella pertussis]|nr:Uncharacterised protein [Bordetella pertussis]